MRNLNWIPISAMIVGLTGVIIACFTVDLKIIALSMGLFSIAIAVLVVADNRTT